MSLSAWLGILPYQTLSFHFNNHSKLRNPINYSPFLIKLVSLKKLQTNDFIKIQL